MAQNEFPILGVMKYYSVKFNFALNSVNAFAWHIWQAAFDCV